MNSPSLSTEIDTISENRSQFPITPFYWKDPTDLDPIGLADDPADAFEEIDPAIMRMMRQAVAAHTIIRAEADAPKSKPSANDNLGIRLLSFAEFKAQENSTADALVKGLVRTGTLIAIGGRPGAGKTALTLAMADALDSGAPFLGRETKPTTIVVIAAEDGGDVANRLEAMGNERIKIAKLPEGLPLTKPQRAAAVTREVIRQAKALDPDRHVMIVVDTLRAALGGVSVLEDKTTSPALNALREVAEAEGAVVAVLNHTNRENNKATKGETLEAVAALELVLLEGEGDWFNIYVGKNRSGPGHRNIGKVRYTSANVGDVSAAVVDELVADETIADGPKERGPSDNAKILQGIIRTAIIESTERHRPFGAEGPAVKVVKVEDVRAKFYERKEGATDTKKKAFTRAVEHWLRNEWIVRGEDEGGQGLLWFARAGDERAGQRDGTPPNQASVPSVPIDDRDGTGQAYSNCPVCPDVPVMGNDANSKDLKDLKDLKGGTPSSDDPPGYVPAFLRRAA